ncbi:DNA-directed RNA polymerase I subunit RPA49-like [Uloborus diversus]|uniref:DNA-directed RNA polymerase I subunit RPA49-like n=1 Tax=Uloborus diversus TaxID=327109 RepID=UPI002408F3F1|nr:DNA-directed RNA polymerase I subunit RPA49-like [Uloborus diversus]
MTMYDVDVFFLKPLLKCTLKIENIGKSFVEKADDLALSFGSKSIQTFVKSRNKQGQLNLSSLESISVKSIDEGLKAMTSDMQQDTTTTPSIFPQPNENATDVSQIYNLHDILQNETYDALEAESNIFLNVTRQQIELWKQENKYCEFITKFLEFNLTSMNAHKSKLLLYLHYMTCFLRLTYLDWRKKDPLPEVPQVFKKELMDKFVINKKMSQTLKDKLVAHALILVLILSNYFIDAKTFCSSVKFPMTRLTSIAYALGCYVSDKKNENTKIILLKLPLYKPAKKFKRKK